MRSLESIGKSSRKVWSNSCLCRTVRLCRHCSAGDLRFCLQPQAHTHNCTYATSTLLCGFLVCCFSLCGEGAEVALGGRREVAHDWGGWHNFWGQGGKSGVVVWCHPSQWEGARRVSGGGGWLRLNQVCFARMKRLVFGFSSDSLLLLLFPRIILNSCSVNHKLHKRLKVSDFFSLVKRLQNKCHFFRTDERVVLCLVRDKWR